MSLWQDKRRFEGLPELKEVGGGSFVLVTSSLHNEFDNFKESHKEQTKRGYSMFPLNELLKLWNNERETPSPQIILFRKTYLHLEANEIDDLCDWLGNKQDI